MRADCLKGDSKSRRGFLLSRCTKEAKIYLGGLCEPCRVVEGTRWFWWTVARMWCCSCKCGWFVEGEI